MRLPRTCRTGERACRVGSRRGSGVGLGRRRGREGARTSSDGGRMVPAARTAGWRRRPVGRTVGGARSRRACRDADRRRVGGVAPRLPRAKEARADPAGLPATAGSRQEAPSGLDHPGRAARSGHVPGPFTQHSPVSPNDGDGTRTRGGRSAQRAGTTSRSTVAKRGCQNCDGGSTDRGGGHVSMRLSSWSDHRGSRSGPAARLAP